MCVWVSILRHTTPSVPPNAWGKINALRSRFLCLCRHRMQGAGSPTGGEGSGKIISKCSHSSPGPRFPIAPLRGWIIIYGGFEMQQQQQWPHCWYTDGVAFSGGFLIRSASFV